MKPDQGSVSRPHDCKVCSRLRRRRSVKETACPTFKDQQTTWHGPISYCSFKNDETACDRRRRGASVGEYIWDIGLGFIKYARRIKYIGLSWPQLRNGLFKEGNPCQREGYVYIRMKRSHTCKADGIVWGLLHVCFWICCHRNEGYVTGLGRVCKRVRPLGMFENCWVSVMRLLTRRRGLSHSILKSLYLWNGRKSILSMTGLQTQLTISCTQWLTYFSKSVRAWYQANATKQLVESLSRQQTACALERRCCGQQMGLGQNINKSNDVSPASRSMKSHGLWNWP